MTNISDTTRQVRIGAAQLMIEQDLAQLPANERGAAIYAREELETMMRANTDFPLGRLQLGDYYFRQNNIQKAINEYEMALKMDSLLTPVYSNLATAYSIAGNNRRALKILDQLLILEPEYGRGYYLRGLLQHELGNDEMAIVDMEMAIQFDRFNFRSFYNLANLYLSSGEIAKAERNMISGLAIQPDSEEGKYLLNLILSKSGKE